MEFNRALPASVVIKFMVTGVVLPFNISSTCLVFKSRLINGFSKNNANSFEFSAEFLMARSSDSTLSNDLDFEAAVYVALAYRALRPYRSRGGRCAASVAIDRRTTEVVAVRRRVILDNIINVLCCYC